ncbi:hypothetical protein CY34DRAFT_742494 [Suillus luteus UH-Slu-Lm8-n1]|uniref:Uncharacterized protein n=1 Tax=Suillus luteus UH-Slu-Lm8-n1 TaxID=930992 RepID=A0A0C9Z684_9AGAM|nr:hypothetical protein CY34DRAFT_742494 [Suillus luteus UH-Slu-Lm8-n1]
MPCAVWSMLMVPVRYWRYLSDPRCYPCGTLTVCTTSTTDSHGAERGSAVRSVASVSLITVTIDHFSLQGSGIIPVCCLTSCAARENPVNRWMQNVEAQEKLQVFFRYRASSALTVFDFSREIPN